MISSARAVRSKVVVRVCNGAPADPLPFLTFSSSFVSNLTQSINLETLPIISSAGRLSSACVSRFNQASSWSSHVAFHHHLPALPKSTSRPMAPLAKLLPILNIAFASPLSAALETIKATAAAVSSKGREQRGDEVQRTLRLVGEERRRAKPCKYCAFPAHSFAPLRCGYCAFSARRFAPHIQYTHLSNHSRVSPSDAASSKNLPEVRSISIVCFSVAIMPAASWLPSSAALL